MLYQNARLYDEWKGEDYEGSSCRGAIKGFHKHGVCSQELWPYYEPGAKIPGEQREWWQEDAARTPLGAYYRIDTGSLADLQAAIYEVHAIYVSAEVHDGWDRVKEKAASLVAATIQSPKSSERGGHAFAIVGYTPNGFIVQNSWGPKWGFHGFALLHYADWSANASDAWVLALGAPISSTSKSPVARTAVTLEERSQYRVSLRAAEQAQKRAGGRAPVMQWTKNEEAEHIVFVGNGGRADRELVTALDAMDAVSMVVEKAVNSGRKIAIYCHGGLNNRDAGVRRAQILGPWFEANGIHPIFIVWQTGFFESAQNIVDAAIRTSPPVPPQAQGKMLDQIKEGMDRSFEVFARNFGVKAIWEDMKNRAELASGEDLGGMKLVAGDLAKALSARNASQPHLLGHSAGAIMIGSFLAELAKQRLKARTIHLWAPACTVGFALETYAKAFETGTAKPTSTFISILSDDNERADSCVPALYSKSLLYLVSRALEPDHKTPVLGLQKAWAGDDKDDTFKSDFLQTLADWKVKSAGIKLDAPIVKQVVPIRRKGRMVETVPTNHGSFDNNLDVVNLALERILGAKPAVPVTDLKGF